MNAYKIVYICVYLTAVKVSVTEGSMIKPKQERADNLHRVIKLIMDDLKDQSTELTDTINKKKLARKDEVMSLDELAETDTDAQQDVSPVARYLLKRVMHGTSKGGLLSNDILDEASPRDIREDQVIGIESRGNKFPWDLDCSGGYQHCGGYFPLCCEGFVCLKPLTPWDIRNGFKRCWPHYFEE